MANNLNRSPNYDDEIDLIELIKILLVSKKLIISTILIFTIASIIYSLSIKPEFKSSSLLEIGYYEMPNGTEKLIEKPYRLISHLKSLEIKKNLDKKSNQKLSMKLLENNILSLETTSSSAEQNVNLLTEYINYIVKRHSNLTESAALQINNKLSFKIEIIKDKINYFNLKLSEKNQTRYMEVLSNLNEEAQQSELLKLMHLNSKDEDTLFDLKNELATLINKLESSNLEVKSKSQIVGNIETDEIKPKTLSIISLGIFIGFITGTFLTLINNFIKNF